MSALAGRVPRAIRLDTAAPSRLGAWLLPLCRRPALRRLVTRWVCRREGGTMWSRTLRAVLRVEYQVEVGRYSYGPLLMPGELPPGTRIGNYCSIAPGVRVMRRNHPVDRITQHPLFYNALVGLVEEDSIPRLQDNPLTIGHDVWIGADVLIAPGCTRVGNSAIIASGSVVTSDVPAFAIVGGVPAKLIRPRLSAPLAQILEESAWWDRSLTELLELKPYLTQTLTPELAAEFSRAYADRFSSARTTRDRMRSRA